MDADPDRILADGQLTMSDAAWDQARIRASVIGSLAERGITGFVAADEAALGEMSGHQPWRRGPEVFGGS